MSTIKPHRRQFIITTCERHAALENLPTFRTRQLDAGLFLHHDEELIITDDGDRIILGRMLREGDGRYATIRSGWLSLDATGSLAVHYFPDGEVICSSSPILLQKFSGRAIRTPNRDSSFNWVAAPDGPTEGSFRLFSDQSFNLLTRETHVIKRLRSGPRSLEENAAFLAFEATDIARELGKLGKPLYVALTAGQDSRTIFAALVNAKVSFKAFTMRLSDGASLMDIRVASQICKAFGVEHIVTRARQSGSNVRREQYMLHSGEIADDRGRDYAAGHYYRDIPDNAIVLHGGSLGMSKPHYDHIFGPGAKESAENVNKALEKIFGSLSPLDKRALAKWHRYRSENPIGSIGDHFFLDQRRATWGADNRFAEDVFGFEWFIFGNSWSLIDAFWSASGEERHDLLVQKLAINIMTPELNERVPKVNPGMTRRERIRGRLSKRGMKKIIRRFHRFGKNSG